MRKITHSIFIISSVLFSSNVFSSSGDYKIVSECVVDGETFIQRGMEFRKELQEKNPRIPQLSDEEKADIRKAQAICDARPPLERARVKEEHMKQFRADNGIKEPEQKPFSSSGSGSAFSPGSMFNPIHVIVH